MPVMRIKELREAAGLTQGELAKTMNNLQSAVANWESEVALPRSRDLPQLAKALGVKIGDLFEQEQEEEVS